MILDRKARSDDNDRDLVPDRMLLLCHELKSVHLWHHQIENDDVRNAFPEPVEGETPILGLDQQPPLGFQPGAKCAPSLSIKLSARLPIMKSIPKSASLQ